MSLRNKIFLILSGVAILYVAVDVSALRVMVTSRFTALENAEAARDLQRAIAGIAGIESELASSARAMAVSAQACRYVADEPVLEDLGPEALETRDVHLLLVLDRAAGSPPVLRSVWGRIEDPETREEIEVREFPRGGLSTGHPLFLGRAEDEPSSGLLATERGVVVVASHPILAPDGSGEPRGAIVLGRFFDDLRAVLLERAGVEVDVWPLERSRLPARERELMDAITASADPVLDAPSDERLHVYSTSSDVRRAPELMLRVGTGREITRSGFTTFRYAALSSAATALLILLVLLRLLQRIVIRPLARLTSHAVEVGRTEDPTIRIGMDRSDELGQLSREFDSMMEKLAKSRTELVRTARLAGMSEIATGVLHNVGNVLNSVNVSANVVARKTEQLAVRDLQAMAEVLNDHAQDIGEFVTNDARGRRFLPFLNELASQLASQQGAIAGELRSLGKGIEHIMELVRNQQSYAGRSGVAEEVVLSEVVDAALSMCKQAYGGPHDVEVEREYEELPPVLVEKHKLMEVLVNLIQNARQALEESGRPDKRLTLRVRRGQADRVEVEVGDNGIGIEEANLARIFNHGFTTKEEGHGFGLHVSANAATEMKASLHARSDGPGKGAAFVLSLPLRTKEAARAA